MGINQYIQKNFNELKQIVDNITRENQLADDLLSYCLQVMLEYPKDKMDVIIANNHAKFFFISIVQRQWHSNTSPFFKLYRNNQFVEFNPNYHDNNNDTEYDYEFDKLMEQIINEYNNAHIYIKTLIKLKFFDGNSYRNISQLTTIPKSSLYSSFDTWRKQMKNKYNKINQ